MFCKNENESKYDDVLMFQLLKIKGVFRLFDKDEDGDIPAQELGTALRALGAHPSVRISYNNSEVPFVRSFVRLFVRLFVRSFVRSFVRHTFAEKALESRKWLAKQLAMLTTSC